MKFSRVEDGKLWFYVPLSECKNCQQPMLNWYKDAPSTIVHAARMHGVVKESYRDAGVCCTCVEKGGFLRECETCYQQREFPKEFAYEVTYYPEFPEGETGFEYICRDCVSNKKDLVIEALACSDSTKAMGKE